MMTTSERGRYWRVTDPAGRAHLIQAAPTGTMSWSVHMPQGPIGWLGHAVGTRLINVLIFRRGWTVVVWQGDAIAPKRTRSLKHRHPTMDAAVAEAEQLAREIPGSGVH